VSKDRIRLGSAVQLICNPFGAEQSDNTKSQGGPDFSCNIAQPYIDKWKYKIAWLRLVSVPELLYYLIHECRRRSFPGKFFSFDQNVGCFGRRFGFALFIL
jgi:hypothetical protein